MGSGFCLRCSPTLERCPPFSALLKVPSLCPALPCPHLPGSPAGPGGAPEPGAAGGAEERGPCPPYGYIGAAEEPPRSRYVKCTWES